MFFMKLEITYCCYFNLCAKTEILNIERPWRWQPVEGNTFSVLSLIRVLQTKLFMVY